MRKMMTVEELAQYLRVDERTVYRLLKQGSLPAIKVGRQWRFDMDSINEWLSKSVVAKQEKILIVDDEEVILELFKEVLRKHGHRAITAKDGSEALELVKQQDFSLVFLDLKLPGMDGAELFRNIRLIRPDLQVVIITGYPNSDIMSRALAYGPFGIIKKPLNDLDIIAAINTFLQTSENKGERRKSESESQL